MGTGGDQIVLVGRKAAEVEMTGCWVGAGRRVGGGVLVGTGVRVMVGRGVRVGGLNSVTVGGIRNWPMRVGAGVREGMGVQVAGIGVRVAVGVGVAGIGEGIMLVGNTATSRVGSAATVGRARSWVAALLHAVSDKHKNKPKIQAD